MQALDLYDGTDPGRASIIAQSLRTEVAASTGGNLVKSLTGLDKCEHPILTCYLPLGDPKMPDDLPEIYTRGGVDVFELGLPCKDPHMDGAEVVASMNRALKAGWSIADNADDIRELRERLPGKTLILIRYGGREGAGANAISELSDCVDGVLTIGEDATEAGAGDSASKSDLPRIGFVSADLRPAEVESARRAQGYVMLQAARGKTGAREDFDLDNKRKISWLRDAGVKLPILLGFGISDPAHARLAVRAGADGVVIGSACLELARTESARLSKFLALIREALDGEGGRRTGV